MEIDSSIKESAAAYEAERQTALKEVTQNKAELSTEK